MDQSYIIRLNFGSKGIRYGTIAAEHLRVSFVPTHRTKSVRRYSGIAWRELEQTGVDKSRVDIRFRNTDETAIVSDRGTRGLYPGNTHFRLLDRHQHIRTLTAADVTELARRDEEIARREAELKEVRSQRATFVAEAWKRATKLDIDVLETKAQGQ